MIPASPENLQMPAPPSGMITPFSGLGTPTGANTPVRSGDKLTVPGAGGANTSLHVEEGGVQTLPKVNIHPAY